jgi:hypothetical protein
MSAIDAALHICVAANICAQPAMIPIHKYIKQMPSQFSKCAFL